MAEAGSASRQRTTRSVARIVAVVAVVATLVLVARPARAGDGLQLLDAERDGRLETLTLYSPALAGETHVRVLLPVGYDEGGEYAVLFLLHGQSGSYLDWTVLGDAAAVTEPYPFVVVMPDGGPNGWYRNWYYPPGDPDFALSPQWETYHIDELVPFVDERYSTIADRRGIVGNSMGGQGSLSYAALHPELFQSASALSGADDYSFLSPISEYGLAAYVASQHVPVIRTFGPDRTRVVRMRSGNPADLASNLTATPTHLIWGSATRFPSSGNIGALFLEAFLGQMNHSLRQKLTEAGVAYTAEINWGGVHDWPDFRKYLVDVLPLVAADLATPRTAPTEFDHVSFAGEFGAWGWEVELARTIIERAELADAERSGFSATGSGQMTVTTPGAYCPDTAYGVSVRGIAETVTSDANGRLEIAVGLGRAHQYDQYTLPALLMEALFGPAYFQTARVDIDTAADSACA